MTEAHAITIHKSQGISANRIVGNLSGKQDLTPGPTYVALSRVRSLRGLLIEEPFTLQRLRFKPGATIIMRNPDLERRAGDKIPLPVLSPALGDQDFGLDISLPDLGQVTGGPGMLNVPILHYRLRYQHRISS